MCDMCDMCDNVTCGMCDMWHVTCISFLLRSQHFPWSYLIIYYYWYHALERKKKDSIYEDTLVEFDK